MLRAGSPNGVLLYQEWVFMRRCFLLPTCKPRPWQTFAVPMLEEDLKDSPHNPTPHPKAAHFMLSPHSTQFMPGVICVSSAPPHRVF